MISIIVIRPVVRDVHNKIKYVGTSGWLVISRMWVRFLEPELTSSTRWESSSDPNTNGHLHYPNVVERSLNEDVGDKIREYHVDYNNNPPYITLTIITR